MGRRSPLSEPGEPGSPVSSVIDGVDPGRTLADLRERGAQEFDAIRFRFIEALARRAAARQGAARRVLDDKLATVLAAYVERHEKASSEAGDSRRVDANAEASSRPSPLTELVRLIAVHSSEKEGGSSLHELAANVEPTGELKALGYFRNTWSKLNVDRQLTHSLAELPKNAGPLNSQLLVLRSLELMREVSPAYLQRFMTYVDALHCLDQVNSGNALAPGNATPGEGDAKRKPARGKSGQGSP
jgi:hypothetical protein